MCWCNASQAAPEEVSKGKVRCIFFWILPAPTDNRPGPRHQTYLQSPVLRQLPLLRLSQMISSQPQSQPSCRCFLQLTSVFLSLLPGLTVVLLPRGAISDTVHASIRRSSLHRESFQYVQRSVEWSVPLGPHQHLRRRVAFGRNPVLLSLQKAQGSFTNMTNMQSN